MRLRKVRLAGFKSFVDPTTISLPGDLIAVVGPNGCGKSNIIDAVRWVMGEISAKHLRGETMADVVFTGSNTRKPVSQASVELVFDNAEGRVGGQYAGYAEIAVRRQVSREAQSVYYLNGTRCRRRDVTDLFFGTGLGPRSYAIIEQGMISRVIEARPEELRDFLEEAAGISKYKERRRETENRMRHTQENLDRLEDLREELGKRLQHLKRQATMAERYKEYKEQERRLRTELLALRWSTLDAEGTAQAAQIGAQETRLEAARAAQLRADSELERQRAAHATATEEFNDVYRNVLDAGAAIARTEESIQGLRRQREELDTAAERERRGLAEAREHLEAGERRSGEARTELAALEPELERLQADATAARLEFRNREEALHHWQTEWEALSERAARPSQVKHAEEARIEQLGRNIDELQRRLDQMQAERDTIELDSLQARGAAIETRFEEEERSLEAVESALARCAGETGEARERQQAAGAELHAERETFQTLRAQLASLQALQEDALGKGPGALSDWLTREGLDGSPRLAEVIEVEAGWERAVESVLARQIEAVCVDRLDAHAGALGDAPESGVSLVRCAAGGSAVGSRADFPLPALAGLVRAPSALGAMLHGVYVADGLDAALAERDGLRPGETIVCRDGVRVGREWLQVPAGVGDESGILARERQIHRLDAELAVARESMAAAERAATEASAAVRSAEEAQAAAQRGAAEAHRRFGELKATLGAERARIEQTVARRHALGTEIEELAAQVEFEEQVLAGARERLERTVEEVVRLSGERVAWEGQRQTHRDALEAARERWHELRDEAYEVGLRAESLRARLGSLGEAVARGAEQVAALEIRCAELERNSEATRTPLAQAETRLESQLADRARVEEAMRGARERVEGGEQRVRELDEARAAEEARVAEEREALERLRLAGQEVVVRRRTVVEQIGLGEDEIRALLETLGAEAAEDAWGEQLESVERRITRLGPINLAAIDEYEQQSERKQYLDSQNADLAEALATLHAAIQKIDRETRARFKDTYERVDAGLKRMFPRLFGGGTAWLELTDDDLLNAGVSVMARPPGKRNTSIHLLSGGEKALTAVALVFSIFELNPAPFCLLDEVDAPLDDSNVARFCDLVREMSERVQFLLVTHNKLTMEMAQQLIGVTMNEPGVSRLVAVDVDEAVELAAV